MNIVQKIAFFGAINWGLVGLFDFNLVEYLFGDGSVVSRIVYTVVAISGLINIIIYFIDLDTPRVIKERIE